MMIKNKYLCLSHLISQNTPSYGNRDKVLIRQNSSIHTGDTANSSCWIFSNNHIGTHIDVPRHFSDNGKKLSDYFINEFVFEKCGIVDIPCETGRLIGIDDFENQVIESDIELLLIRTGFETHRYEDLYWNNNPGLASELAEYFRNRFSHLRCIGFDFISITSWNHQDEGKKSHKVFLCPDIGKEILIIEDMSLINIYGKLNKVIVAPFFVEDGNGGAVSVIAEQN